MEKSESDNYEIMSDFQKQLIDCLKDMGFTHKYFSTYEKIGYSDIKVSDIDSIKKLILFIHNDGMNQKRYEILNVLGVIQ